jgi:hypothetical protein
MCKDLATTTLLVRWLIWNHRNSYVFDRKWPSAQYMNEHIKVEATLSWGTWPSCHLAQLPIDWDVH